MRKVLVELYKWEGKFWPFEIKTHCGECSLNRRVIERVIEEFSEQSEFIEFVEKPWLDNWFKVLLKGGWHAPIVLVDGKVIGQEKVLSKEKIKDAIMSRMYQDIKIPDGIVVYTLPGCKFCKKAKDLLKEKKIDFIEKNVIDSSSDMMEVLSLVSGKIHPITMPQIFFKGTWVGGFDDLCEFLEERE